MDERRNEMCNYTKIKEIGRGGFGVVDEVQDSDGKRFAKKTFAPTPGLAKVFRVRLLKRFLREVKIQKELGKREIIPVLDSDLTGDSPWFIMPLATKTYKEKIEEDRLAGSVAVEPIADILNGLQRLHELGYVHRDLNPNNILLHEGVWKLSDLGTILPPTGHTVTLTEDTIIYTERYCAPEQRQDFHNSMSSADIYSFGCILHDLFCNTIRTPYATHNGSGTIGIIIEKCTNQNPLKRPIIDKLRTLVLDAILEEGGHCAVVDAQASEWLKEINNIDEWDDKKYDSFARFFAGLDLSERTDGYEADWVYSLSTPFMTRLTTDAMQKIVDRKDGISTCIVEKYCEWARNTAFEFNFSDSICTRLKIIFDHGGPAEKACAFAALVKLGYSHNRWFIMRRMIDCCKQGNLNSELEKRLAIELKVEDLENAFVRCVDEIEIDKSTLSQELAKLIPQ